jgi:hypothetical protein
MRHGRHGGAGIGPQWCGATRQAKRGRVWQGSVRLGETKHGRQYPRMVGLGVAGGARYGRAGSGGARLRMARQVRLDMPRRGAARLGMTRQARHGRHGGARCDESRTDMA